MHTKITDRPNIIKGQSLQIESRIFLGFKLKYHYLTTFVTLLQCFSNRDYQGESITESKPPLASKKPRTVGIVEPRVVVKIPWTKIGGFKKTSSGLANPSTPFSQGTSLKQMPLSSMTNMTPDPNDQDNGARHLGFQCRKEV